MSIYDPISNALGIEPFTVIIIDDSDIIPGNTKNSQAFNLESNRLNASKGGKAKAAKNYPAWNKGLTGFKRSQDSIEKQRKTIIGKKRGTYLNYNHQASSKQVTINGIAYPSIAAARRDTGMGYYSIMKHQHTEEQAPVP